MAFLIRLAALVSGLKVSSKEYKFLPKNIKVYLENNGLVIYWALKGFGFGTLSLGLHKDKLILDTECMSPDFVAALLFAARDKILTKLEVK